MGNDAQSRLIEEARNRFGPKSVLTRPLDIQPWLTDWRGRFRGQTNAILAPATTEEVSALVTLAQELGVPLVPQGGNTSMVGGATPPEDGSALILSLRRMNRLRSISAQEGFAVAEAGMILANLHDRASEIGMRFPLTLGAKGSATVGGLVSTNAGGTQVLRFGTMRALAAGLEAVLPNGAVFDGLSPLKKDARGYDLNQLLIGSEGTLGIVTAAALRLVPAASARAVAWVGLADPHAALDLLRRLDAGTDLIEGFELVPAESLELVLRHIAGTRGPLTGRHYWHALIEATSPGATDPREELEPLIAEALEAGVAQDAVIASNEAQAEAFWRIRDSISEAERAEGPTLAHDISVPVSDMPGFMVQASTEVERAFPGVSASGFGHLGDGNIHFHVRAGRRTAPDWYDREGPEITRFVHDLVTSAGGSISAEHGIGQMKLAEFERLTPRAQLDALRAIKRGLDPKGLMNPGKLIP